MLRIITMCQKYTMPHVFTVPSCSQASFLTRDPSKGLEKLGKVLIMMFMVM